MSGVYLSYNRAFAAFYGVNQELWVGRTAQEVLPQAINHSFMEQESFVLASGQTAEALLRFTLPDRGELVLRSIKFAIEGVHGDRFIGGMDIDITEEMLQREHLEAANRKLEQLARTDALTGLYSRGTLDDRMYREYAITERKGRSLSVLVLDIDDFQV